jgi:hypothetical protein
VCVDQAGQTGVLAEIDKLRALRSRGVAGQNCADALSTDDDQASAQCLVSQPIDQRSTANGQNRFLFRRRDVRGLLTRRYKHGSEQKAD